MKRTIITFILLGFFANAHASFNTFVLNDAFVSTSAQYAVNDGFNFCYAIRYGEYAEFKALLSGGMNPNIRCSGQHPLYLATENGDMRMVRDLLNAGANPKAKTYGRTALQLAEENGYDEIAKIISDAIVKKGGSNSLGGTDTPSWLIPIPYPSEETNPYLPKRTKPYSFTYNYGESYGQSSEEINSAETVFENIWRSIVVVKDSEGHGSGVIIRPNIVATNCHVVNSGDITVYKHDNRRASTDTIFYATVIERDDDRDLCLLAVAGLRGSHAKIRGYDSLKIGENVYALGSPQGLDLSLSTGIVSQLRQGEKNRYIQTDAAISPGSSGGGLFDSNGNLVGILTGKVADMDSEGIGFAVPADIINRLLR